MFINDFLRVFPKLHRAGTALELISGPGLGKSSAFSQGAAALSRTLKEPVAVVSKVLSGMDAPDVRGFLMPVKDADNSLWARFTTPTVFPSKWNVNVYVDGVGSGIGKYKGDMPRYGVLFLDEFGQADTDVQKPMGQLLLDRGIDEHQLPDGWVVWCASNRVEDRSGVVKRLMFLQNRMKVLNLEPSYDAWENWAMKNGIHPLVTSFAKRHPGIVFRNEVPKEAGPFCTPRSLVLCAQDLLAMRDESHGDNRLPDDNIALEIIAGWIGEGAMTTFVTHIRLANDLPELEDVIRNPKTTKIPDRIDARYVMAMTLAFHINKKNGGAIVTYMSRLDDELQILFVGNVMGRDPSVLNVPEFQKWTQAKGNLAIIAFS